MKNLSYFLITSLLLSACAGKSRFNRPESLERNYVKEIDSVCSEKLFYGHNYIELTNLTSSQIFDDMKIFLDSILGEPKDTLVKQTFGNPWGVAQQWIRSQLFVDYHNNYFGYEAFPRTWEKGFEEKLIHHGVKNTYSRFGQFDEFKFHFNFRLCTKKEIATDSNVYRIHIQKKLMNKSESDSILFSQKEFKPKYTNILKYDVKTYKAKLIFEFKLHQDGYETEYYTKTFIDKVRVYKN
ncbi:MAG: hypothetical protein ACPGLV_15130 [Bacteroidia bacterium]